MPGLYVHIPFCKRACGYCDFFKSTSLARRGETLDAMRREMRFRARTETASRLDTIYFGGGTPTVCTPRELDSLLGEAFGLWDCAQVKEITVEANPDDLSAAYLSDLKSMGVNRLSIGVQSFSDDLLRRMNRRHDGAAAIKAIEYAFRAGFENISIDLIYGLPGLDCNRWADTLRTALSLGVQHISAYHLSIEPQTPFGRRAERGETMICSEEESVEQYRILHETLSDRGYEHYEISSFALPGCRSVHNSSYWADKPYVGIGPAAHSYDGCRRSWAPASVERYVAEAGSHTLYESEVLTPTDRYNEYVMVRLRTAEGIDRDDLAARFGARELLRFASAARRPAAEGSLRYEAGRWSIPPERFLTADAVIVQLLR